MLNRKHVLNKDQNVSCSLFCGKQSVEHALTGQRCLSISLSLSLFILPQTLHPRSRSHLTLATRVHSTQIARSLKTCVSQEKCILPPAARGKAQDQNLAVIPACFPLLGWGGPHQALSWSACCAWGLLCCSLQIHLWVYSAAGTWGFLFPQKKTKLDCDKHVAPNKNTQHLLSNFAWRNCTVNYIVYAITLFFNYIVLTHGRAALLNLVVEQRGSEKESI